MSENTMGSLNTMGHSDHIVQEKPKVKVLLVDDHAVVRDGIRARLERESEFEVVGEAINGRDAIHKVTSLSPDVVLMDISMPVMNGMDAAKHLRENYPDTKVIILTMHEHKEYIQGVIRCGAHGYIVKDVSASEMISAIKTVCEGDTYYSSCVSQMMYDDFSKSGGGESDKLGLTQRQKTILALVEQGMSSKAIANELNISVRTVEAHRHNIKIKLDAQNAGT
ncbi:MAG: response regulator transcription factor [Gammaproteobacteria bacterium]|nr:response regulator transcription factor [Gammaproteobacteria bacterium]MDH5800488.1 response regulator transcription factor [Gammaproteobacteria bacterium]